MATTRIPDSALVEGGRGAWLAGHCSGRPDWGSLVWDVEERDCIDCTWRTQSANLGANYPPVIHGAIKQLREIAPIRPVCSSPALSEVSAKPGAIASAELGQVAYSIHGSKAVDRALSWTLTPTLGSAWSCCATRSARASAPPPLPCSRSPRLYQATIATALGA
jgi:hypothetical protein